MLCRRVLALVIGVAALASPAFGSSGASVAYTTDVEGEGLTLASVNPDGSDSRVLVPGSDPAWSLDGRWLAYTREYQEIWRVRSDGTGARRMMRFRDRLLSEPSWSPNDRRIAFSVVWHTDDGEDEEVEHSAVYVVNRDGSGKRRLRRNASRPAWSPDGRRIAIQTATGGVATLKANGRGFKVLHQSRELFAGPPRFSPNGRWLLFLTYTREEETVAATRTNLVDMRTGRLRQIALRAMPGWPADVTWTPSGRIAFLHHAWSREGGATPLVPVQLKTIRRDGTNARTLANLTEWALPGGGLSWRPNGPLR